MDPKESKSSVVGSRLSVRHVPVLLQESLEALDIQEGETFLDGTFGAGGHSREVRRRFGDKVEIIALDQDPEVKLQNPDFDIHTLNFRHLDQALGGNRVDAILLDIGFSSDQLEQDGRGFSFLRDEPLDMRMGEGSLTASHILNSWDEHAIELILRGFGEEKSSRKIARAIVEARETRSFETTFDLVEVIEKVRPKKFYERTHPATKTFQALRIAVNEELDALEEGIEKGFQALNSGGRLAIITFHSLEDRIVKRAFKTLVEKNLSTLITKKPITPREEERESNPRSRSAKLRVIEKI